MIHLHRAEQLDVLLDALADVLRPAPPDPFTRDLVVVPAAGISDAVQAGLARRLGDASDGFGVCANVEFVFPGRFIARALGDPTAPDLVDTDPWRLPRLAWWVLDELHAGSLPLPGARSSADGWPLARRIADLIDRYTSQRPSLIEAWAKGIPTDGTSTDGMFTPLGDAHLWQLTWWQAVRARSGQPSAPERLPALLAAVVDGRATIDLPQRLSVFGVGSLPPAMAGVLAALSQSRDVHVFLKHPSMAVWQRPGGGLSPGVHTRDQADATEGVQHPLLASWGRPALEAQALLRGNPAISDEPCATAAPATPATSPDTLLGAVQRAIRLDLAPGVVAGLDGTDGTFQVHACHGSVRQLEALRDALGHAFIADSSLKPHEVLVLCPDLDTYAPLIEAVFQRGNLPIPVKVGDRSLTTQDPLVGALHAVLQLVSGRATLTEVLALAQFEPVRRRFGWTIDQVEQLADWCVALGTRWGLSAQHRAAWGLEGVAEGTWRTMVDQLLAGVAMQAPTPRKVLGELSPFDDLSNDDMVVVGSVAELLARLDDVYEALQSPKPVSQWVEMLLTTVDMFTA
ncbi:MAG: exodeoxyribonuclease V subunit gamma, partial [Actinomycetota bacterium]